MRQQKHLLSTTSLFFATALLTLGAASPGYSLSVAPGQTTQNPPPTSSAGAQQSGSQTGAAGQTEHPGSARTQQRTDQTSTKRTWQKRRLGKGDAAQHKKRPKKSRSKGSQSKPQSQPQ
jgi:hypothetical protein